MHFECYGIRHPFYMFREDECLHGLLGSGQIHVNGIDGLDIVSVIVCPS